MELHRRLRVRAFIALTAAAPLITAAFGVSTLLQAAPATAAQTIPYKVNFQGRLTDNNGNVLSDGSYNIKFRIFNASTSGTNLWEEDRVFGGSDNRVTITNGLFNVQFGDLTALSPSLFNGAGPLYLEVELPTPATATCATNGCASFTEGAMTPRQPLAASPYAFNADTIDGIDGASLAQLSAANSFTDTNTFSKSGGAALVLSGSAASGGSILQIGSALSSGNSSGTLLGANTSTSGDLLNLQVSNATKLRVDNSGNLTLASGAAITVGSSTGQSTTCSGGQVLQNQVTTGGVTTGGTCATPSGTGANTSLSNLVTTSINQSLIPNANNSLDVGSQAAVWAHVYAAIIDAGTTTTTLGVGTTSTTTAVTLGNSSGTTAVNGSAINLTAGTGNFSLDGAAGTTYTIGASAVAGTITLGGTGTTGTIAIGNAADTAAQTVQIATGGTGVKTITIGGSAANVITMGNTQTAGSVTIGNAMTTGTIQIGSTAAQTGTITLGGGTGNQTINLATGNAVKTVHIADGTGANVITLGTGQTAGSISLGTAMTTGTITLGGAVAQTGTIILGQSTGTNTVRVGDGTGATTIQIGTGVTNAKSVQIGTGAAMANTIAIGGTGANTITLGNTQTGGSVAIGSALTTGTVSIGNAAANTTTTSIFGGNTSTGTGAISLQAASGGLITLGTTNGNPITTGAGAVSLGGDTTIAAGKNLTLSSGTGTFSQTYSAATATAAHSIAVTNTNTGAGVTMQGINLTPGNTATPSGGTNTLNLLNFAAGSALGGSDATNGINFASATGYTNFLNTPTAVLSSSGAFTGLTGVSLASGNVTTPGNISTTGSGTISSAGTVTVGSFAAASSTLVCSNGGTLATCNTLPNTTTLQQAYNNGNTISTGGNDIAFTLNSGQNHTVATAAGATGGTIFSLTDGSNATPPAQLVLVKNNDTDQPLATGISVQSAAGGITTAFDASGSGITNALAIGGHAITGTNFSVAATGAVTAVGVNAGSGAVQGTGGLSITGNSTIAGSLGSVTSLTLSGAISGGTTYTGSGNINTTGGTIQTGSTDRITNAGGLTNITGYSQSSGTFSQTTTAATGTAHAIAATLGAASGTNTAKGVAINLTGVANGTGSNASTGLDFGNVSAATNNTYTAQNFGTGFNNLLTYNGSTVIINGTGQLNGAQIQSGTIANGALANSSFSTSLTGLTGSSSVALGGTLTLATAYGSAANTAVQGNVTVTCPSGSGQLTGGGTSITLGTGGTCGAISITATPTFTSVTAPTYTGAGAVTLSSGGSSDLTLDSASNTLAIAATDTKLQRTATGTYTIDLTDSGATTLAVTNSGTGVAALSVEGGITSVGLNAGTGAITTSGNISTTGSGNISSAGTVTVGSFASATNNLVCSNAGTLASCNANPSGVTLQQAYAAGNTISTTGNDIGFTLNSGQNFTISTATGGTGFTSITRADGAGTADPAQLLLVKNNDIDRPQPIGIKVDAANTNGKITTAFDASSTNITTALAIGGNAITGTNFGVNSSGAITAATTGNTINGAVINGGALSSLTGVTLTSGNITTPGNISTTGSGTITSAGAISAPTSTNTINNLVINNGALSGVTGYTQGSGNFSQTGGTHSITSSNTSGNVLSLGDTALNTTGAHLADLTFTNANATSTATAVSGLSILPTGAANGNSNANTLNALLFPNVATIANNAFYGLSFGTGYNDILRLTSGTSIINGSGQVNGAQIQSGTIANGGLANSSFSTSLTGLTGSASVSLGGTLTLATAYGSSANTAVQGNVTLGCPTVSGNLTGGGGTITLGAGGSCTAIAMTGTPTFTSVTAPTYTGTGAVTLSSGGSSDLTLDSASNTINIAASDTTLKRTASGTYTIDLNDTGATTLAITNSNTGVAGLNLEGAITAATSTNTINNLVINNGALSNVGNITGAGAVTLASGGSGALTLDSASNVLGIAASDTTLQRTAAGTYTIDLNDGANTTLSVTNSGTGVANLTIDGAFTGSGSGLTNLNPTNLVQGTGAVTLQSAAGQAANITSNAAATWQTTSGLLTLTGAAGVTVSAGGTAQNISLTPSTTGTVIIGGSTPTITTSGATALAVNPGGAAALNLGTANATTVSLGNTGAQVSITAGTAANAVNIAPTTNGGVLVATTGTGVVELDSEAGIIAQSTVNTTQAFQIQNSGGVSIFNVDTSTGAAANLLSNTGFEKNPMTNWSGLGTGSVARDITQAYVGFASGKVTTGTTAGNGAFQAVSLTNGQQYTLSFYAKADATTPSITDLQAGYSNTGAAGGEVDCTLNSTTIITAGWNRYICTFVAGSPSGSPYIYIEHATTTSDVFYVDSVQLETGSFATPYGQGLISLNATINSPVNFQASANSNTAFQITNTTGTNILNIDTLNSNLNNQATNPSFETGLTGWSAKTGCTLTQDSTTSYNGTSSGKCVTSATSSAGFAMTGISPVMVSGTTYTLSMYVKASSNMTTLEIGRSDNGVGDTSCLTGATATAGGWKRFTCSFTPSTQSGSPYIYVKQTDAVARTIWVDAVTMETDANASTNYRDGRISLGNATISSPAVFQTSTNSTTAFQIQNAAGIQVFDVDTASDNNLVANPGFEVNTAGWSLKGSATALLRDTSKTYVGIASGKVTTTATNGDGLRYTFAAAQPGVSGTSYTISGYVQTSAADSTFTIGYNNGSDTNCATITPAASATSPSTTGWTRFTCVTPTNTVLNSIYFTSGTTAVTSFNVDGVRVELGGTATAYGSSNISFNGVFTSPVTVRNPGDTTTEFQVQTAASLNLLTVDSLNKNVIVGGGFSSTDTTGVTLTLDSNNTFAETAGTCSNTAGGGTIYYNSSTNTVRECVRDPINSGGSWEDLPSTAGLGAILFGVVPDSGITADQGDWAAVGGATKGPCKVSWATATSVSVAPCNAYSGGRKVTVASATSVTIPQFTNGNWYHLCFSTTTGAPALTSATSSTELINIPTFSANNPVLCLADIQVTAAAISKIFDLRTFTTTTKEFVTNQTTAAPLGTVVSVATTTPAANGVTIVPTGAAGTANLRGVVLATTATATTGSTNAIVATAGPQWVKFSNNGTAGTLNNYLQTIATGGTAGYMGNGTSTNVYATLGMQLRISDITTCNATTNCQMSVPTDIRLR